MNRKDGVVFMTREDFEHFANEALHVVLDTTEGSSPMTSMLVGATATIAFGKLKEVIFGKDEKDVNPFKIEGEDDLTEDDFNTDDEFI